MGHRPQCWKKVRRTDKTRYIEILRELKATYNENLTFYVFKRYNLVPGASTNSENVKKQNPVFFFFKLVKKLADQISLLRDIERGSYYDITAPESACFHLHIFHKWQQYTRPNAMKVWANCCVFGCTDEHRTLFRVPASEETWEHRLYLFISCILCCCHTDPITCDSFPSCLPSQT